MSGWTPPGGSHCAAVGGGAEGWRKRCASNPLVSAKLSTWGTAWVLGARLEVAALTGCSESGDWLMAGPDTGDSSDRPPGAGKLWKVGRATVAGSESVTAAL